ncbi:hypothetical protein X943_001699 [Babesia divergens]|uniref:Uncharacterized protein n=1 Tax=Babesia divergens TaxID=32595 RepID=A0AAD9GD01_BABDI|nr:hypothetical protein X943_001699 [Babesia divergens]
MDPSKKEEYVMLANGRTVAVSTESTAPNEEGDLPIERLQNVWGSSSGARSEFFDIYCRQRNAELERSEELEKQWKEDLQNKLFHTIRYNRMQKEQIKSEKRKQKRVKKKMKNKGNITESQQNCHEKASECDTSGDKEEATVPVREEGWNNGLDNHQTAEDSTHSSDAVCIRDNRNKTRQECSKIVIFDDLADLL